MTTRNGDAIVVDGPFPGLTVCVNTEKSSTITLTDPSNNTINAQMSYNKGAVYLVPQPQPGTWELSVSDGSGSYRYTVKATIIGHKKIKMFHNFILLPQRQITRKETPILHPLSGKYHSFPF